MRPTVDPGKIFSFVSLSKKRTLVNFGHEQNLRCLWYAYRFLKRISWIRNFWSVNCSFMDQLGLILSRLCLPWLYNKIIYFLISKLLQYGFQQSHRIVFSSVWTSVSSEGSDITILLFVLNVVVRYFLCYMALATIQRAFNSWRADCIYWRMWDVVYMQWVSCRKYPWMLKLLVHSIDIVQSLKQ